MIFSDQTPVSFQDELPEAVDVVVIGGGVIGISTAWFLAKQGVRVLVCEKGRVAGEQSSRNWGWIRKQSRDPDELPIVIDSQNIWAGLADELGEDLGFVRHGVVYLAETEQQLAHHAEWLDVAQQHQLDTQVLSGTEVDDLIDGPPGQYVGALHTPSDARAEPFLAGAGLGPRGAAPRWPHHRKLRSAGHRASGWASGWRRHRTRAGAGVSGGLCWRRLDIAVSTPSRHQAAATDRARHSGPHRAGTGRLCRQRGSARRRLSPPSGWRLHPSLGQCQRAFDRAGLVASLLQVSA